MANAVTALAPVPMGYGRTGIGIQTIPLLPIFDTLDSDFTIYTPASDQFWAIVGIQYVEASAHVLTFKSGTTSLLALEMPANSGRDDPLGTGIILVGQAKGEGLALRMSTALISSLIIYVQEFKEVIF